MRRNQVKLSDNMQNVFILAEEVDKTTIRLDISDAYNDSSIELTVDRENLLIWCQELLQSFGNTSVK